MFYFYGAFVILCALSAFLILGLIAANFDPKEKIGIKHFGLAFLLFLIFFVVFSGVQEFRDFMVEVEELRKEAAIDHRYQELHEHMHEHRHWYDNEEHKHSHKHQHMHELEKEF